LATTLDPHIARAWGALSYVLELKGDTVGALSAARQALDVDPYERDAGSTMVRLVFHHLYDRQYDSARSLCNSARLRFPNDAYVGSCELSVLGWSGSGEKDLLDIRQALRRTEASGSWPLVGGMFPVGRYWLAAVLARNGQRDSARAVVRETRTTLQRSGHGADYLVNEAQVLVILGEHERALDLLAQATRTDPAFRTRIVRSPWFDALRRSPRFVRLTQPASSPPPR
jgi:tetratricopeptide (TPR) repeat protein